MVHGDGVAARVALLVRVERLVVQRHTLEWVLERELRRVDPLVTVAAHLVPGEQCIDRQERRLRLSLGARRDCLDQGATDCRVMARSGQSCGYAVGTSRSAGFP